MFKILRIPEFRTESKIHYQSAR